MLLKPASIENGPVNGGGEAVNGGMPKERSFTPVLPDIIDYNMCYLPNGYPSPAYYYGGTQIFLSALLNRRIVVFVFPLFVSPLIVFF